VLELDRIDCLSTHALRRPRHTVFGRSVHDLDFSAVRRRSPERTPLRSFRESAGPAAGAPGRTQIDRRNDEMAGFPAVPQRPPSVRRAGSRAGFLTPDRRSDTRPGGVAARPERQSPDRQGPSQRESLRSRSTTLGPRPTRRAAAKRRRHPPAHFAPAPSSSMPKSLADAGCVPRKTFSFATLAVSFPPPRLAGVAPRRRPRRGVGMVSASSHYPARPPGIHEQARFTQTPRTPQGAVAVVLTGRENTGDRRSVHTAQKG